MCVCVCVCVAALRNDLHGQVGLSVNQPLAFLIFDTVMLQGLDYD